MSSKTTPNLPRALYSILYAAIRAARGINVADLPRGRPYTLPEVAAYKAYIARCDVRWEDMPILSRCHARMHWASYRRLVRPIP